METETHVIFGSGAVGHAIARELLKRGKKVRMVNRSGAVPSAPAGVELVAADCYQPEEVRRVSAGAAAAYQCAQPGYTEWPEKFPPLQASIIAGLAVTGVKLIVAENLYMYGEVAGALSESLPNRANSRKGETRAEMAEAALAAHRDGKLPVAIARSSDFYGPLATNSSMGERIFPNAIAGKKVQGFGDIDLPHTYTYIDDFAKAMVILGEHEQAFGEIWHVPNAETLTTRQFIHLIFEEAGVKPNQVSTMSSLMLRIGGLFIPEAREMQEIAYQYTRPFVVDSSKFTQAFGDISTPLRPAIQETIAWYRNGH